MKRARGIAACVAALAMLGGGLGRAAEPTGPEVKTYVVQPGDSVWSIAAEFYGSGDKYPLIYQYNEFVGKPPFLLKPGQLLKLPILGTGPEAQVGWMLREVRAKPPRALDWLEAKERMNLWRLYRVATGDESAAHIVFEDRSDLKLRENAMLVIYGASASAARTARRDKVEVMLEQGTIQGGLAALDEAAKGGPVNPMVVKTPSGQVDIYGKLAQIQAESIASMISVFDGNASVSAKGATVQVAEGQGTVVKKGQKPEPARPLPPPPGWVGGAGTALVAIVQGQKASWEAAWEAVPAAETYRVELATDATFKQVLFDAEVGKGVTRMKLADLAAGRYAVRIGTRDAAQLESKPGQAKEIEVLTLQPTRALDAGPDGVLEAVGFLKLGVPKELAATTTVSVDGGAARPGTEPIYLANAGLHALTFKKGSAETTWPVRILGVSGAFEVSGEPLARGAGDGVELSLAVKDERGRKALLPGLVVESSDGRTLPVSERGGRFVATLEPLAEDGPGRVAVRARWLGGELATREVAVEKRVVPEVVEHTRDLLPLAPNRVGRGLPGPLSTVVPESRVVLDATLADDAPGSGALGLVLQGEWAASEAFGLDAAIVAQDLVLGEEGAVQSRIGDLSLGLRYALSGPSVQLAPYARISLPVGPGHGERLFGVEPGVLLRILASPEVSVDAKIGVVYGNDFADASVANLGALLGVSWRPVDALSLTISGQTVAGLDTDFLGHVLGLGAQLCFGDLRLGLALGLGLGDDGEAALGAFSGRFVLDVGIPR